VAEAVASGSFELKPDKEGLTKSLGNLGDQMKGTFSKLGGGLGDLLSGNISGALSKVTSSVGGGNLLSPLTAGVVGAAAGAGVALFKLGSDFDKTYKGIQKQTGATGKDLDALKGSFKNVATQTGASFEDISSAVSSVSQRTGATGKDLEALSLQMLRLSSITGTDLNANIEKATGLFNGWKIETADMPKYLDKLYTASSKSGIGVDALMAAAEKSGPIMRQFNFSFDESIALLATFDKAGLNTTTATAALNAALKNQQKMIERQGKAVDTAGKQIEKFQALQDKKPSPENKKNLEDAIKNYEEMNDAFKHMQDQSPAEFLAETVESIKNTGDAAAANQEAISVFGGKAGPQLAEAIRAGTISMDELVEALGDSEGALKSTAGETATFSGKMAKFKNQMKVAFEPVAMGLFDAITGALMFVTPYLSKFATLVGTVIGVVLKCKPLMIALGVAIGGLAAAWVTITVATKLYNLALAAYAVIQKVAQGAALAFKLVMIGVNLVMAMNPFVLVVIAIVALVAAFVLLWTKCEGFRNFMKGMFDVLKSGVMAVKDAFVSAFDWIMGAIGKVWDWIKDNWPLVVGMLGGPIGLAIAAIVKYWDDIWEVLEKVIGWFTELPGKIVAALGDLGTMLLSWITTAWDTVSGGIGNAAAKVIDWFQETPGKLLEQLGDLGEKLLTWVSSAWTKVYANIGNAARKVTDWFKELPGKIVGWIGDLGGSLLKWMRDGFDSLSGNLGDIASDVVSFFKKLPGELLGVIGDLGSVIVPDLSGLKQLPKDVKKAMTDVVNEVKALPGKVTSAIGDLTQKMKDIGGDIIAGITGPLSGIGTTVKNSLKDLPKDMKNAMGNVAAEMTNLGSKAVGGLSNGMRDASQWVVDVAKEIPGKIKNAIGDAGKMLLEHGKKVIGGLTNGMRAVSGWIGSTVGLVKGWVTGALGNVGGWLAEKGKDIIRGFWHQGIGTMKGWLQGMIKIGPWVWNSIGNARAWLKEAGKNVIRGLWDGIDAMRGWIMNKMRGLLDGLKKLLPFSPPKDPTSPLAGKGQPIYSGISIGRQLAQGMVEATPLVQSAARDMAEAAQTGVGAHIYDFGAVGRSMAGALTEGAGGGDNYNLTMNVAEADTSQLQAGFRRLELLSGAA
jgi:TP901 family phage tail tape measure protein